MSKTSTKQAVSVKIRDGSYSSSDYIRQKVATEMAGLYLAFNVQSTGGKAQVTKAKSSGKVKKRSTELAVG